MKKFTITWLALSLLFATLFTQEVRASASVCKPTDLFCDEFTGTSLDLSKWQPNWYGGSNTEKTKPVNGAERACYDPAQVSVGRGKLRLTLTVRSCKASNGVTYPESTGAVSTLYSFQFQDGTLTARAYLPGGVNVIDNWPAIWTDGQPTWPHNGESDIMEGLSGKACWHYHSDAPTTGTCVTLSGGWHTFAEDVRNGTTKYYYDGSLVGTTPSVKKPHFIIMGNQSGTYGGPDTAASNPVMKVAYIRVEP